MAGLLLGLATSSSATAAPIELVEQRSEYVIYQDVSGELSNANWFARDPFLAAYDDIEAGFLATHDDDSQFLIIYTTWKLPAPVGALYQSVANDVQGIGYEHIAPLDAIIPEPYFDDTPNSQVQGFMHMNDWTSYLGQDDGGVSDTRISLVFGQELGHAWLSFVHTATAGLPADALLGRSEAHWSFYMNSGGSPVEGHEWLDNGDGTFTAVKHDIFTFSDLDLYLMGLMPARQVQPWFVLSNPTNCVDAFAGDKKCAPADAHQFAADSYTVTAQRNDVTIDDVIAMEGPRVPAFGDAPTEFDASFLLITRPGEVLSLGEKQQIDTIVERSIELFNDQTRERGRVVNRTMGEPSDDDGGDGDGDDDGGPADDGTGDGGLDDGLSDDAGAGEGSAGGGATATATDTDGNAAADDAAAGDDGCACAAQAPDRPSGAAWLFAGLLGLLARRRTTRH